MTQFNCLESFKLAPIDSIASRDEDGKIIADSCEVRLFYTSYYGDSLATMKTTVYELARPMMESEKYYSDFDPLEEGYVREGGLTKSKAYTLENTSEWADKANTSNKKRVYVNNICIRLNEPYTDKNGVTYNNFGTYILRLYYEHPEYFRSSYAFINNVLPGLFFKHTGGLGSMAYVSIPQLNIYYNMYIDGGQKVSSHITLFNGTEEVLQTTRITNDQRSIERLVSDTVTIDYQPVEYFHSVECGAMFNFDIKNVRYTKHGIDSVVVVTPLVTNSTLPALRFFLKQFDQ